MVFINAKDYPQKNFLKFSNLNNAYLGGVYSNIFLATIVIWFLQTFDLKLNVVYNTQDSILALLSGVIAPVFKPLGFGDWRISTALISGFMAKESVVSTLTVLFGTTESILAAVSPVAAISLLIFCLLYTPCVAAVTSVKRELGAKWAAGVVIGQCTVAWVASFLVYTIGNLFI